MNITLKRERIRSGRKRKDSPATNPYEDENYKGTNALYNR